MPRTLAVPPADAVRQRREFMISTIMAIVSFAAIVLVGWFLENRLWAWLAVMGSMIVFSGIIGWVITKRVMGVLIDKFYTMSLSRMQTFVWTIVILGGYLTAAFGNIVSNQPNPLQIGIPYEIWIVLGISTTSLVGKGLILNGKTHQQTDINEQSLQLPRVQTTEHLYAPPRAYGSVLKKASPRDAGWIDMFTGDEVGNKSTLDLGKLQMFLFTLVLVVSYGYDLGTEFYTKAIITEFPPLDLSTVALFGISHASYLANKAVPHTKVQS